MDPTPAARSQVVVHVVRLDEPHRCDVLSPDERLRAARFVDPVHRRHHRAAHAALRVVLGAATGRDPAELRLVPDAHGRPQLPGGPDFNLSHSGGLALVALGRAGRVGVDVEALPGPADPVGVAGAVGTPEEVAAVRHAADPAVAALRLWTLKEAAAKATGRGLGDYLRALPTPEPAGERSRVRTPDGEWDLVRPACPPRWIAALACPPGAEVVVTPAPDRADGEPAAPTGQAAAPCRCMP